MNRMVLGGVVGVAVVGVAAGGVAAGATTWSQLPSGYCNATDPLPPTGMDAESISAVEHGDRGQSSDTFHIVIYQSQELTAAAQDGNGETHPAEEVAAELRGFDFYSVSVGGQLPIQRRSPEQTWYQMRERGGLGGDVALLLTHDPDAPAEGAGRAGLAVAEASALVYSAVGNRKFESSPATSIIGTALHEVGHALGLSHSDYSERPIASAEYPLRTVMSAAPGYRELTYSDQSVQKLKEKLNDA